jgi:hypothetical protein
MNVCNWLVATEIAAQANVGFRGVRKWTALARNDVNDPSRHLATVNRRIAKGSFDHNISAASRRRKILETGRQSGSDRCQAVVVAEHGPSIGIRGAALAIMT